MPIPNIFTAFAGQEIRLEHGNDPTPAKELLEAAKGIPAQLDLTKLADKTLSAIARDSATPQAIRVAAEQEIKDRAIDEGEPIAASYGGGKSSLVKAAEKRASEVEKYNSNSRI